jgi:MFS family permease
VSSSKEERAEGSGGYAHYVLLIICLANALNVADRMIVQLLLEPIKNDLHASDTAMSILSGASFVLFYCLFGIPIARWSDRGNRRGILALGVAVWSVMTAVCGLAQSFWQMALARAGVGMGESAGTPTSLSLITDYYAKTSRPRMISFYQLTTSAGGLAFAPIIGLMSDHYGWRSAFLALGIPGILVALLVRFTIREPERGRFDGAAGRDMQPATLRAAIAAMWSSKPFMLILLGTALTGLGSGVLGGWGPAIAMRRFGVTATDIGAISAPISGIASIIGALAGGFLTTWVAGKLKDQRWIIALPATAAAINVIAGLIYAFAPNWPWMVAGGALGGFTNAFRMAPYLALTLDLVPPNMRGMAASAGVIATTQIGQAGGPLVVGMISDALAPSMGPLESLRTAFVFAPIMLFLGTIPFYWTLRHYDRNGPKGVVAA